MARGKTRTTPTRTYVRLKDGSRRPFLRGMLTHDLVGRGLPFEDAYGLARAIRDRISDRQEVTGSELNDLIDEQIAATFDAAEVAQLNAPDRPSPLPTVAYSEGAPQPFSRGLLARSMMAAGVDDDRAYRIATDAQAGLLAEDVETISSEELAVILGSMLEESEGRDVARRYRTMRRIGALPRPLVIYLSGATGTGKSTLALELAPLLRVYQINATDTIRQVMRMVFSPAILPGLHRSSFEGESEVDEPAASVGRGVLAAFEDQATRVLVGVRAVVDRALAENVSVLLEGVHLLPSVVPFEDLRGSAYQVALMLATLDEEAHRRRFLTRGAMSSRLGERYLRHFDAIRTIQDYLVVQAENNDVPVLDTQDWAGVIPSCLHLVASDLAAQAPWIAEAETEIRRTPTLCLFIDGLADRPVRALSDRTPLQAATLPTFDRLAREGVCGLADPLEPDAVPDTAAGTLALFGQTGEALERGPVEALGVGLEMGNGDVALRGNFATLDAEGRVVDRRAGRIREHADALAASLDGIRVRASDGSEVEVRVRAATEHRLAIVLRGEGLSSAVVGSDPGDGAPAMAPLRPQPAAEDDPPAARTASVLAAFEERAREILASHPANEERVARDLPRADAVLTRGAGMLRHLEPPAVDGQPISISVVGGDRTVLGVAASVGAR
ncbi:MAG: hypothetical protein R3190_11575, partial [Thermoanaerobaculia bacterium]|nr:hypothetical protein [Thermoanaerobaculia bacterium]